MDARAQSGLISVVMPCYNAEKYLAEAIDSVLGQSYRSVELILVDDGSTDSSKNIARHYGKRLAFLEQENQGPYRARNRGFEASQGEYIAFLDADDYWAPDCLEHLHRALSDNNAALAYCGWQNIGITGPRSRPYIQPDYELDDKALAFLREASPWPIHAALTRRGVIEEVGCFDERYSTCMDYDLWLRVATSRPIRRVEKVLAFYRHHAEGQITSQAWRQAENVWRVKKNFIQKFPERVSHLAPGRLRDLVDGALLYRGYDAYWRRDVISARKIFRMSLKTGSWQFKDLRYLLPALLPQGLYFWLIQKADQRTDWVSGSSK